MKRMGSLLWVFIICIFVLTALTAITPTTVFADEATEPAEQVEISEEPEEEGKWIFGLYYNPADPRFFVPKRIAAMGWTLNLGHPFAWVGVVALVAIIFLSVYVRRAKNTV